MKKSLVSLGLALAGCSSAMATMVFVPIDITAGTGTTASQSTSHPAGPAGNGIDGNLGNFTHTTGSDPNPSWSVDFGRDEIFNQIIVHNRDGCCSDRLSAITVQAFDVGAVEVYNSGVTNVGNALGSPAFLAYNLPGSVTARSITVSRDGASTVGAQGILSIGELQIGAFQDITIPLGTQLTTAGIVGMTTAQSSNFNATFVSDLAVDGNLGNFTHTLNSNPNPTWEVNFGELMSLESIDILNRTNCCGERLRDITLTVHDENDNEVFNSGLLNPNNALGFSGTGQGGLFVDLLAANGGNPISGQTVRLLRTQDPTGGTGADDSIVLALGEVIVTGGSLIPEPSTAALLGLAVSGLALRRRRR